MSIKSLVLISTMCVFGVPSPSTAWNPNVQAEHSQQAQQVEPMEETPVFRTEVISRTTKAVDYRHRGGSTRVDLKGTDLMPRATGEARVESKKGRLEIKAKLSAMEPANKFGLEYLMCCGPSRRKDVRTIWERWFWTTGRVNCT